ncbi:MAG: hypothetical protein IJ373_01180 [Clostridia bacterium]|nr:hypothetical protein [Clostridia bacterium]MBQ8446508.1 hypothetical protein [Clostridia bacterium]
MKLEKREITLNEADSLKDIYYLEKTLLREYSARLALAECQETKHELSTLVKEVAEDMENVEKLMKKSIKNCALIQ